MPRVKNTIPWGALSVVEERADDKLAAHNIRLGKRRTSLRLDGLTWNVLGETARREGLTIHELCRVIEKKKPKGVSLTVGVRRYLLQYYRDAATESGDAKAGRWCGFCRRQDQAAFRLSIALSSDGATRSRGQSLVQVSIKLLNLP